MSFIMHFYIIFGTNLLTQGPVQIAVFLPISVFRRKGISNGVQTEWNLRERDFWNKRDPEDLEWTSRNQQGGHEAGRRACPPGRALPPRVRLSRSLTCTPSLLCRYGSKNNSPEGFIPFGLRLIFLFCKTLKLAKKTAICSGPWVSRLVPKII